MGARSKSRRCLSNIVAACMSVEALSTQVHASWLPLLQIVSLVMGGGRLEVPRRERLPGPDTLSFAGGAGSFENAALLAKLIPSTLENVLRCCCLQGWTGIPSWCVAVGLRASWTALPSRTLCVSSGGLAGTAHPCCMKCNCGLFCAIPHPNQQGMLFGHADWRCRALREAMDVPAAPDGTGSGAGQAGHSAAFGAGIYSQAKA